MRNDAKKMKKIISVLVIILLVSYSLISYLPHAHEHLETDCAVCNMIDFSKEILIGIALLSIAQILPTILFRLPAAHERVILFCEGTPVGLKVKLSD